MYLLTISFIIIFLIYLISLLHKRKKICIVMSYTDNIKSYSDISKKINQIYASKYNYDIRIFNEIMTDRAPQWCKIKVIQKLLNENCYEYLFWIDSDAFFNDHTIKIQDIIKNNTDKDIIICDDHLNSGIYSEIKINTGTIIVKCTEWNKEFFDLLWNYDGIYLYNQYHEQRLLEDFIKNNIMNCKDKILIKPCIEFNTEIMRQINDNTLENNYIIHLMKLDTETRISYMKNWFSRNNFQYII